MDIDAIIITIIFLGCLLVYRPKLPWTIWAIVCYILFAANDFLPEYRIILSFSFIIIFLSGLTVYFWEKLGYYIKKLPTSFRFYWAIAAFACCILSFYVPQKYEGVFFVIGLLMILILGFIHILNFPRDLREAAEEEKTGLS